MAMEEVQITHAKIGDLKEMLDIRNRHNLDRNKHWSISYPGDDEDVSTTDGNVYFVARLQNMVVGYMWLNSGGSSCSEVELFLVVDKNCRGKKVGSALRDHAIKHATKKGFKRLFAQVKASNNEANALFKGWKKSVKQMGALYSVEIG
jgi:ribosomal protein S18 acetylase RimI-like enzyme